jgi:hypothetical protein
MPTAAAVPRGALAAAAALCIAAPAVAHAQSAEAEALFEQGNRLMAETKLADACDAFDASRRIEPLAGTLIRLAQCREANHQLASAWAAYKDALARAKDPRKRDLASVGIRRLEPLLSRLTIEVPDDVRIDGLVISRSATPLDTAVWNQSLPVDGGDFVIAAHAPGHVEWRTPITIPESSGRVTIRVPRLADIPRPAPIARPPVRIARAPTPTPTIWTLPRKIALATGGTAVATTAVAVILARQAKSLERDAFHTCPDPATPCDAASAAQATLDRSHRRALYANLGFGIAAAAAVATLSLWFTGAPHTEPTLAVAPLTPLGASSAMGLVIAVSFR